MSNFAIVRDGKVENVVVASANVIEKITPKGASAVEMPDNSEIGIGWLYDGDKFSIKQEDPAALKQHAARLPPGLPIGELTISGLGAVNVDEWDREMRNVLPYLARSAERDPNLTVQIPRQNGQLLSLTAQQVLDLEKAIGDRYIELFAMAAEMFAQIDSGAFTTYADMKAFGVARSRAPSKVNVTPGTVKPVPAPAPGKTPAPTYRRK